MTPHCPHLKAMVLPKYSFSKRTLNTIHNITRVSNMMILILSFFLLSSFESTPESEGDPGHSTEGENRMGETRKVDGNI